MILLVCVHDPRVTRLSSDEELRQINLVPASVNTHGERFIRVRSEIRDDVLSVVVENSFDGIWSERGGVYLSRKVHGGAEKPREGIGISSARAVCARYDGMVKVDIKGNTWKSGALLDLTGRLKNVGEA